jgi:hypothetical protein
VLSCARTWASTPPWEPTTHSSPSRRLEAASRASLHARVPYTAHAYPARRPHAPTHTASPCVQAARARPRAPLGVAPPGRVQEPCTFAPG